MSNRSDPDDHQSTALEDIVARFEAAWQRGQPPVIEDLLPAAGPLRFRVLPELLLIDLEYRLKAGQPARVEEYRQRFPALAQNHAAIVALIVVEFRFRRRAEPALPLREYLERFPEFGQLLASKLATVTSSDFFTEPEERFPQLAGPVAQAGGETVAHEAAHRTDGTRPPEVAGHEILGVLGRGGMGVVYKARHRQLDRLVALKMIRLGEHVDPAAVERFQAEARAVARLRHPSVVQIHEIGEYDGRPYFSLEFVDGGNLAQRLAGTPLLPAEAARLVEVLARTMQAAHQEGIVHRDLKPANVLLARDGTPKITDFGLAKHLDDVSGQTQTGTILGTPSYMAPEQAAGYAKHIGPAADVYALGATLYETLTGQAPFRGPSVLDTLDQVRSQEPVPPGRLQPKVPRDLETICLKCLQKDPDRRYGSAQALADDLHRFLRGEPIRARPVSPAERFWRWCRRNPALAVAGAVALAALVAVTAVSISFAIHQSEAAADLLNEKQQTEAALEEARRQASAARRQSALQMLETGLRLCDQHEEAQGMLWFARSLLEAPAADSSLHSSIRRQLASWQARLCPLHGVMPHEGAIRDVAFAVESQHVITAGEDRVAHVWDARTGKRLGIPMKHAAIPEAVIIRPGGRTFLTATFNAISEWEMATGASVGAPIILGNPASAGSHARSAEEFRRKRVAFGPNGERLATASGKVVQLWETASGKSVGAPMVHQANVQHLALSSDGRTLLTMSGNGVGTARLWDAATGQPGPTLPRVLLAAFSPHGHLLVTGDIQGGRLWDVATGKPVGSPLHAARLVGSPPGVVSAVGFSPDGQTVAIATGRTDKVIQRWEVATGKPLGAPLRHPERSPVRMEMVFSPGGNMLATASTSTVCLWDLRTGQMLAAPLRMPSPVTLVAFSPDEQVLLTASSDRAGRLWDLSSFQPARPRFKGAHALAFTQDGRILATAGQDRHVHLWETATGTRLRSLEHQDWVQSLAFSPDGRALVTGLRSGVIKNQSQWAQVWDLTTEVPDAVPLPAMDRVLTHGQTPVAFSSDGKFIAAASGNAARLWDVSSRKLIGPPLQHKGTVQKLAFRGDGSLLVTASQDGTARLWEVPSGKPVGGPLAHAGVDAAFSPTGDLVATAGGGNQVRLWDVATGEPRQPALRHSSLVTGVRFSPDGRKLVTFSVDNTARLWDVATGKPLAPPLRHQAEVRDAAFGPDSEIVATASFDHTARLWDVATGKPLGPAMQHDSQAMAVAFSPDGQLLATGSTRDTGLWKITPAIPRSAEQITNWLAVRTGMELDSHGSTRVLETSEWHRKMEPRH